MCGVPLTANQVSSATATDPRAREGAGTPDMCSLPDLDAVLAMYSSKLAPRIPPSEKPDARFVLALFENAESLLHWLHSGGENTDSVPLWVGRRPVSQAAHLEFGASLAADETLTGLGIGYARLPPSDASEVCPKDSPLPRPRPDCGAVTLRVVIVACALLRM